MGEVFVGDDWAEAHHDVFVEDEDGGRLGRGRLPEGVEGVARFHELVAGHVDDPAEVVIAIETDRGLFVAALVAAGYQVFAVNPMSTSRYRERHSTSGAKSDPGDAQGAGRDGPHRRPQPPPVAGDSDLAEAVKVLARAHQTMIWTRQRQTNLLRSTLREFYPAALVAFDDLDRRRRPGGAGRRPDPDPRAAAVALEDRRGPAPGRPPTPHRGTAGEIQAALRTEQLAAPPLVARPWAPPWPRWSPSSPS